MKTTTTLMDILQGELQRSGYNEFFNDHHLDLFDDDIIFIQKIMHYDKDVQKLVDRIFFRGYKFPSEHTDFNFKKSFINRFLNREIAFQTVEVFSARVVSKCINQEVYITECFDKLDDFINDRAQSKTHSETKTSNQTDTNNNNETNGTNDSSSVNQDDNRTLQSDLPSNNINLNVDDTVLDYGNQNNISRNKGTNNQNSTSTNNQKFTGNVNQVGSNLNDNQVNTDKANINSLQQANQIIEMIFDDFDKDCFLQVW